jgi:hypothetical protein
VVLVVPVVVVVVVVEEPPAGPADRSFDSPQPETAKRVAASKPTKR